MVDITKKVLDTATSLATSPTAQSALTTITNLESTEAFSVTHLPGLSEADQMQFATKLLGGVPQEGPVVSDGSGFDLSPLQSIVESAATADGTSAEATDASLAEFQRTAQMMTGNGAQSSLLNNLLTVAGKGKATPEMQAVLAAGAASVGPSVTGTPTAPSAGVIPGLSGGTDGFSQSANALNSSILNASAGNPDMTALLNTVRQRSGANPGEGGSGLTGWEAGAAVTGGLFAATSSGKAAQALSPRPVPVFSNTRTLLGNTVDAATDTVKAKGGSVISGLNAANPALADAKEETERIVSKTGKRATKRFFGAYKGMGGEIAKNWKTAHGALKKGSALRKAFDATYDSAKASGLLDGLKLSKDELAEIVVNGSRSGSVIVSPKFALAVETYKNRGDLGAAKELLTDAFKNTDFAPLEQVARGAGSTVKTIGTEAKAAHLNFIKRTRVGISRAYRTAQRGKTELSKSSVTGDLKKARVDFKQGLNKTADPEVAGGGAAGAPVPEAGVQPHAVSAEATGKPISSPAVAGEGPTVGSLDGATQTGLKETERLSVDEAAKLAAKEALEHGGLKETATIGKLTWAGLKDCKGLFVTGLKVFGKVPGWLVPGFGLAASALTFKSYYDATKDPNASTAKKGCLLVAGTLEAAAASAEIFLDSTVIGAPIGEGIGLVGGLGGAALEGVAIFA
jgi:hypothetical protein